MHTCSWPQRRQQHEQSKHTSPPRPCRPRILHLARQAVRHLSHAPATCRNRNKNCYTGYIQLALASPLASRTPSRASPSFQPGRHPGDLAREAIRFCAESRTPITACSAKACAASHATFTLATVRSVSHPGKPRKMLTSGAQVPSPPSASKKSARNQRAMLEGLSTWLAKQLRPAQLRSGCVRLPRAVTRNFAEQAWSQDYCSMQVGTAALLCLRFREQHTLGDECHAAPAGALARQAARLALPPGQRPRWQPRCVWRWNAS